MVFIHIYRKLILIFKKLAGGYAAFGSKTAAAVYEN
jgi:hypothetical protein